MAKTGVTLKAMLLTGESDYQRLRQRRRPRRLRVILFDIEPVGLPQRRAEHAIKREILIRYLNELATAATHVQRLSHQVDDPAHKRPVATVVVQPRLSLTETRNEDDEQPDEAIEEVLLDEPAEREDVGAQTVNCNHVCQNLQPTRQ